MWLRSDSQTEEDMALETIFKERGHFDISLMRGGTNRSVIWCCHRWQRTVDEFGDNGSYFEGCYYFVKAGCVLVFVSYSIYPHQWNAETMLSSYQSLMHVHITSLDENIYEAHATYCQIYIRHLRRCYILVNKVSLYHPQHSGYFRVKISSSGKWRHISCLTVIDLNEKLFVSIFRLYAV